MGTKLNMLQKKQQWSTPMAEGTITNPDITGVEVEETVEKRDIRKNLLIARKAQLQRKKRGYGKLPKTLRR